jgi:hypothetical protein
MICPFPTNEQIPFLRHFSTMTGRRLANRLNLKGSNSQKLADNVSSFFWNMQAAITVNNVNEMKGRKGNCYIKGCLIIHEDIIESDQYNNLPTWVKRDLVKSLQFLQSV